MREKSFSTSIFLTCMNNKKNIRVECFSTKNSTNIKNVETDNILEESIIKNFLNSNIKSVKFVKNIIDKKVRDCVELKNSSNVSLIIISDNSLDVDFKEIMDYLKENRAKIYEKYLIDLICKYPLKEITFKLNNNKNSEIELIQIDDDKEKQKKYKIVCYIPCQYTESRKKTIDDKDLELVQNTINNYFAITGCKLNYTYDDGAMGYLLKFFMYTDKASIIIDSHEVYSGLELYFNMIKKELEMKFLEERDKDFKKSQINVRKKKFKVIKKDKEEE